MKVVVVLGSLGGKQMYLGRDLGGDDPRLPGDVPRQRREGQPDHGAGVRVGGHPTDGQGNGI